jgi:hypothetical protein
LLIAGWWLAGVLSCAQVPPSPESPNDTSRVTCGTKQRKSRNVRGEIMTSADGKYRAYAEVDANAIPPDKSAANAPTCVNVSRLYVGTESGGAKLVFLEEPEDVATGNSLRLVDWSSDSRYLLVETAMWQYEAPGITRGILVYDARYGTFQEPDVGRMFNKIFGMECALNLTIEGFTPDNKVLLDTQPLAAEEEEVMGVQSCSHKKQRWVVNLSTEKPTAAPENLKVEHYAKSEAARPR